VDMYSHLMFLIWCFDDKMKFGEASIRWSNRNTWFSLQYYRDFFDK